MEGKNTSLTVYLEKTKIYSNSHTKHTHFNTHAYIINFINKAREHIIYLLVVFTTIEWMITRESKKKKNAVTFLAGVSQIEIVMYSDIDTNSYFFSFFLLLSHLGN